MASNNEPIVHTLYESNTGTWQYIIADPETRRAAIIDAVLDFDPAKNELSTKSADTVLEKAISEGYGIEALLETHLHADHLSAASYLRNKLRGRQTVVPKLGIGHGIQKMQRFFADRYGIAESEWANAFDHTYSDGEEFSIGNLKVEVMHLPGHTPDHIGYLIGSNVFTGDSIFNPDLGSARCDFPEGSATALWNSMKRLLSLPPSTRLYTGHDYPPADREYEGGKGQPRPFATVEEHKASNKHAKEGTLEETFVNMRTTRDSTLNEPKLINQALQFNIRGGRLPEVNATGDRLIHVPLKIPQSLASAA